MPDAQPSALQTAIAGIREERNTVPMLHPSSGLMLQVDAEGAIGALAARLERYRVALEEIVREGHANHEGDELAREALRADR